MSDIKTYESHFRRYRHDVLNFSSLKRNLIPFVGLQVNTGQAFSKGFKPFSATS